MVILAYCMYTITFGYTNKKACKTGEDWTQALHSFPTISPTNFLLESLLAKIGHRYYCLHTSKFEYTIQTTARYEAKLDPNALTPVLIAHFGGVEQYYIGASYGSIVYICTQ